MRVRLSCILGCAALLAAAATPAHAQFLEDAAAAVIEAQGQVSVIRHQEEWALFAGDTVRVGEVIVSGDDGYARLQVSDGSAFVVFPDSRVVFRKNPSNFRDLLDILIGRVKIYIQHFGDQPNPHKVYTPTAVISVRGTTFDVTVYDTEATAVAVEEGLVTVRHQLLPSVGETPVQAGESLIIEPNIPLAEARVDKAQIAQVAEGIVRRLASLLRMGGGGGGGSGGAPPAAGGGAGGGSAPLPGDEEAPAPPPAPPPPPQ